MSTASRIRGGFINPNALPFSRSDLMVGPTACQPYDEACSDYLAALDELEGERAKLSKIEEAIRHADRTFPERAAQAQIEGKEPPKDPRQALSARREKAVAAVDVAKEVVAIRADELTAVVNEHREAWLEAERDLEGEQLFDALEALEALEVTLDRAHETSGRIRWLQPDNPHETFGKANAGRHFDTAKPLAKLHAALSDAADRTPMVYLSPNEARKWHEGKAAKDLNGRDVPADIRPSKVKINYSPNGLRESPLGKASDRE